MKTMARQDRDGVAVVVNRDEEGTWIEVQERVAGQPVNVAAAGPLSRESCDDLRRSLAHGSTAMVVARCVVYPTLAAGPAALLAGASGGQVAGPWAAAGIMALTVAFTALHADD